MSKKKGVNRVGLYLRVSTGGQTTQNQLLDLQRYAEQRGWTVFEVYTDEGVSAARETRLALDRLMNDAKKGKFDVLLTWKLDRLARSTRQLVLMLDELKGLGVALASFTENIDFTTPMGRAMFVIISALAELERAAIIERVHAGLRRARQEGKRLGRPRRSLDVEKIKALHAAGLSLRQIGKKMGVSAGTVGERLKNLDTETVQKTLLARAPVSP